MRIIIRAQNQRLFIPIPNILMRLIVRCVPGSVYRKLQDKSPELLRYIITKKKICRLVRECFGIFRKNKGLEIVRVETGDGTLVSIRL